jgi:AraC-like DNA-binding protein
MPTSTIAVFSEPKAFESALQQGCSVELLITGHGKFRARLISIVLPQIRMLQATEWLSRIAAVSVAPGSMLVFLPSEPQSAQKFGGAAPLADEIMTVTPGEPLHTWTIGSCSWGIISVSVKELIGFGRSLVGRKFSLPPGVCRLRPSRGSLQSLVALFNAAMRLTKAQPSRPVETEGAARGLEQEVIRVLIACFSTATKQADQETHRYTTIMSSLDKLLRTHPDEILYTSGICVTLGISAKTLRACCQQHVGVSPGRYIHLLGMRRVHHELANAHLGRDSVSEIAKRHGFNATGWFAAAYRRQFGELPSATLRRIPA